MFGLYGLVIGGFLILVHLCSVNTFGKPYLFPVAPMDKTYLFKTLLRIIKTIKEVKYLVIMLTEVIYEKINYYI